MNYAHIDEVMKAYEKSKARGLMYKKFRLNDESTIKNLSFGDSWALGEQLIAERWGLV